MRPCQGRNAGSTPADRKKSKTPRYLPEGFLPIKHALAFYNKTAYAENKKTVF
jgi:hypothetical protein